LRFCTFGGSHSLLQLHGTLNRVDGAGEFYQHSVSHDLNDPASVMRNERGQDLASPIFELGQRTRLVTLHEAAVTDDIGGEDRSEAALGALLGHPRRLLSKGAVQQLVLGHLNSL
jgi:hypothetical protein